MRNKKVLLIVSALAIVSMFASCKKDKTDDFDGKGFRATIEQMGDNGNATRTHINPTWINGSQNSVLWSTGDCILVGNKSLGTGNQKYEFQLCGGSDHSEGFFGNSEVEDDYYENSNFVAIYPRRNSKGVDNNIQRGNQNSTSTKNKILGKFNLPDTQIYKENSFAEGAMPMAACSLEMTLEFKNVLGGICFPVTDAVNHCVKRVVLTSKGSSDYLYGTYEAWISEDKGASTCVPYKKSFSGSGKSLTLDCGSGVTLSSDSNNPTYFCFVVPPGSLTNGFTLKFYGDGSDPFFEKETNDGFPSYASNTTNFPNGFIARNVIRLATPAIEVVTEQGEITVTTISPTFITKNSALGLGAANDTPTSCGILYALADNLTNPANELVVNSSNANVVDLDATSTIVTTSGEKRFDANLTGLSEDRIYYVRAYATNGGTVIYGDPIPFATRYDYYGSGNNGKSRSTFTVRPSGKQVRFSMGNLQYAKSTGVWSFMQNQFDYEEQWAEVVGENYANRDVVSLFGWGTSGYHDDTDPDNIYYQPYSTGGYYPGEGGNELYNESGYGPSTNQLNPNIANSNYDWGVYNAISNGGATAGMWRTLQGAIEEGDNDEWFYLFKKRTCDYRHAQVKLTVQGTSSQGYSIVNGVPACGGTVKGLIVFPDTYTWPTLVNPISTLNDMNAWGLTHQSWGELTEAQWSMLEQQGAVFLPAAGMRIMTDTEYVNQYGFYWGATYRKPTDFGSLDDYADCYAHYFYFGTFSDEPSTYRKYGFNVRLVCNVEP